MPDDFDSRILDIFNRFGFLFTQSLRKKLTLKHGKDTGFLKNNIRFSIRNDGVVEIRMPEWGEYLQSGTPPHMPPPDELEGWVARKFNLSGKDVKSGAWALAYHIKKHGTRPYPFITMTMAEIPDMLNKAMQ